MKKYFYLLLVCIMTLTFTIPTYAEEEMSDDEWYDMTFEDDETNVPSEGEPIITPRSKYIMGVQTFIQNKSSGSVTLRCEVYCNSTMKSITTTFSLQKLSGGSWKTVSSGTTSVTNTNKMIKSATVSGVSSGTYRTKTVTKVIDSNGYSENATGYSGSITI